MIILLTLLIVVSGIGAITFIFLKNKKWALSLTMLTCCLLIVSSIGFYIKMIATIVLIGCGVILILPSSIKH